MTEFKDLMDRAVELAEEAISGAYWEACDAVQAAVDPAQLTPVTWARQFLADAYEVALSIEADPAPWDEVRKLF